MLAWVMLAFFFGMALIGCGFTWWWCDMTGVRNVTCKICTHRFEGNNFSDLQRKISKECIDQRCTLRPNTALKESPKGPPEQTEMIFSPAASALGALLSRKRQHRESREGNPDTVQKSNSQLKKERKEMAKLDRQIKAMEREMVKRASKRPPEDQLEFEHDAPITNHVYPGP